MSAYKDTLEILRGTDATAADLARFREMLQNAQRRQQPQKEVAAEIERELPHFRALAKQLLVPKNAGEFWGLVSAAAAVVSLRLLLESQPTKVYEDRSVHETVVISQPAPVDSVRPFRRPQPKIGRNEPCRCGSGKKHKHCHGRLR